MTRPLRRSLAALVLTLWLAPPAAAGSPGHFVPGGVIHPGHLPGGSIHPGHLPGGPVHFRHHGGFPHHHGFVLHVHPHFPVTPHGGLKSHVHRFHFLHSSPVVIVTPPGAVILTPGWHWTGWGWVWVPW
jgi:hypothetical protein